MIEKINNNLTQTKGKIYKRTTRVPRSNNIFEKLSKIDPPPKNFILKGVFLGHGAQILRVPPGSKIFNLTLEGGASFKSNWAGLKGAVLKFVRGRKEIIEIDGSGFRIPSAHALMDERNFELTMKDKNQGKLIPHKVKKDISKEDLYLVHASYCHPDELFLSQGIYTNTKFNPQAFVGKNHGDFNHAEGLFFLEEKVLDEKIKSEKIISFNIIEELKITFRSLWPKKIIVQLKEGGHIILME